MKRVFVAFSLVALLSSCKSVPTDIPRDLSQAELVQLAQESADDENWEAALAYYRAVLDRYPQDRAAGVSVQYEIAFIEYKRGDRAAAESAFEQLLGLYDFDSEALPQWPLVLGTKLLEEIRAEAAAENTSPSTAEE